MTPTFIMFHGAGGTKKSWEYTYNFKTNKYVKSNFLKLLETIGNVYTYTRLESNLLYYGDNNSSIFKDLYEPNVTFDFDYLRLDCHIEQLCQEIMKKYDPPYILVAHSAGVYYALEFIRKYKKLCSFIIALDPAFFTKEQIINKIDDIRNQNRDEYKISNNQDLQKIIKKIRNKKDNMHDIKNFMHWLQYNHLEYTRDHIIEKLPVPMITFRDINFNDIDYAKKAYQEHQILQKINGDNVAIRYLPNATHSIWHNVQYKEEIIETIKYYLNKWTNNSNNKYIYDK